MKAICFVCFWINIFLATMCFLTDGGFASIAFSLVCAGLCLSIFLQK